MQEKKYRTLIVEDQKMFRFSLKTFLLTFGPVTDCANSNDAREKIQSEKFDLAFIDLDLERRGAGFDLIRDLVKNNTFVVVLSSHSDEGMIDKAYQLGCHSYFVKDSEPEKIQYIIQEYEEWLERQGPGNSNKKDEFFKNEFITGDEDLRKSISILFEAKNSDLPIFLTGPTGVGKTTLAKKAHSLSSRKEGELVDLNCANIPADLLESELFGHVQGSFTGAHKDKKGKLTMANKGTIFLDEVATLPMMLQEKLLKAIEEKKFYPVGSEKPVKSDFRIISATSANIGDLISSGRFKPDLYFRLSGIDIHIKALKDRKPDILLHIKKAMEGQRRVIFSKEAKVALHNYDWPGNTREVNSQIHRLVQNSKMLGNRVELDHLPDFIVGNTPIFLKSKNFEFVTEAQLNYIEQMGLKKFEEEMRKVVLSEFNKKYGNVAQAMNILKISNTSFYKTKNKIKKKEMINESLRH